MEILDFYEITEKWIKLLDCKNDYVFAEEPFDETYFTQIVEETFRAIRQFKSYCRDFEKFAKDIQYNLDGFSFLLTKLAEYSAEVNFGDESERSIFTASQIITRLLIHYSTQFWKSDTDETGVLCGNTEVCCGCYWPGKEGFDLGDLLEYDTNTGNMSQIIKYAEEMPF